MHLILKPQAGEHTNDSSPWWRGNVKDGCSPSKAPNSWLLWVHFLGVPAHILQCPVWTKPEQSSCKPLVIIYTVITTVGYSNQQLYSSKLITSIYYNCWLYTVIQSVLSLCWVGTGCGSPGHLPLGILVASSSNARALSRTQPLLTCVYTSWPFRWMRHYDHCSMTSNLNQLASLNHVGYPWLTIILDRRNSGGIPGWILWPKSLGHSTKSLVDSSCWTPQEGNRAFAWPFADDSGGQLMLAADGAGARWFTDGGWNLRMMNRGRIFKFSGLICCNQYFLG